MLLGASLEALVLSRDAKLAPILADEIGGAAVRVWERRGERARRGRWFAIALSPGRLLVDPRELAGVSYPRDVVLQSTLLL